MGLQSVGFVLSWLEYSRLLTCTLRGVITPPVSARITNGRADLYGAEAEEDEETEAEDGAGIVTLDIFSASMPHLGVPKPVRTTWPQDKVVEFRGICCWRL